MNTSCVGYYKTDCPRNISIKHYYDLICWITVNKYRCIVTLTELTDQSAVPMCIDLFPFNQINFQYTKYLIMLSLFIKCFINRMQMTLLIDYNNMFKQFGVAAQLVKVRGKVIMWLELGICMQNSCGQLQLVDFKNNNNRYYTR